MIAPNFLLLYVDSPRKSAAFYTRLLGAEPIELADGFAMFALGGGLKLGLWARAEVQPPASGGPGSSELAFVVPDAAALDALYARFLRDDICVLQTPTALDFGYTFTAVDPDGHRLRAFVPAG
jgi:catechol 2,3-dioxygenase-like lactoylglutathione lyase family enzyme